MRPTSLADLTRLQPRRVCLIKPSSLGDVVHALPVLSSLRRAWPDSHLAWVVNRGLRGLLDGHPDLDEVIPFDRASVGLGPRGLIQFGRFLNDLRRRKFDLAIDLQGLLRSGLMSRATGATVRVGLSSAREGATSFYTHAISIPESVTHAVDRLMLVPKAFGIDAEVRFQVAMSEVDRSWAMATLAGVARPLVTLNVGARWLTKRWPPARFAEVARRLATERGAGLVAVGAPEDRELVDALIEGVGSIPILDLSGKTSLPRLAAIMEASDCVISNDTGPLHLAAATGAKVLGVFTCTRPEKTGPYGANARVVSSRIWCAGSCVKTCSRMECMTELTSDRVAEVALSQLDEAGERRASA